MYPKGTPNTVFFLHLERWGRCHLVIYLGDELPEAYSYPSNSPISHRTKPQTWFHKVRFLTEESETVSNRMNLK